MSSPDLHAAEQFLAGHARVLERRRFEQLFTGGDPAGVRAALAAYRTADGGFGYGLEPDGRSAGAQPLALAYALNVLRQAELTDRDLMLRACDWLAAHAPDGGGIPAVADSVTEAPHAPWWAPTPGRPASPVSTGQLLGELAPGKLDHPWIEQATAMMWSYTDGIDAKSDVDTTSPLFAYSMLGVARFLDTTPDAARAERAIERLTDCFGAAIQQDPRSEAEGLSPLGFAPDLHSRMRAAFGTETVEAHLAHLAESQQADGGWTQDWFAWSEVAATEWRGALTVDALYTLRVHDRL